MTVVLAPIDGSARALQAVPWAAKLAGAGGTVILLRVIPARPEYAEPLFAFVGAEASIQSIQDAWSRTAKADLDEAAQLVAGSNVAVEQMTSSGEPDEEIVASAEQRKVDLIAMASHGRGAVGRAIFGSVADRVSRSATVPVLILRTPNEDAEPSAIISRIVVPFDGSEIARRAVPVAGVLARQLGVPAHVVLAVDPVTALPMAPGLFGAAPALDAEVADQVWKEAESQARTTVSDAVATLKAEGVDADGAILSGSPFFAINETTKPGDLVILTSHGRGGVRRWLLGSVAEKLIREAEAPVILVPALERSEGNKVSG